MDIRMSNIASPMPQIRAKFTNKLGIPLSGCKVYTYEPNSDIPKTTWLDIDKTVENTNPILLDSAGEADIFLDGLYRIVVKDRFGFVVYDVEKTGTYTEWDASFVVDGDKNQHQINDLTKSKTDWVVTVEQFGGLENSDNTAAFQAAYDYLHSVGCGTLTSGIRKHIISGVVKYYDNITTDLNSAEVEILAGGVFSGSIYNANKTASIAPTQPELYYKNEFSLLANNPVSAITLNALKKSQSIGVADASGFSVGDYIFVNNGYCDMWRVMEMYIPNGLPASRSIQDWNNPDVDLWRCEIARIKNIVGNTITLEDQLANDYPVTVKTYGFFSDENARADHIGWNNARIERLGGVQNSLFKNIKFKNNGAAYSLLSFLAVNVNTVNCTFEGTGQGVDFITCFNSHILNSYSDTELFGQSIRRGSSMCILGNATAQHNSGDCPLIIWEGANLCIANNIMIEGSGGNTGHAKIGFYFNTCWDCVGSNFTGKNLADVVSVQFCRGNITANNISGVNVGNLLSVYATFDVSSDTGVQRGYFKDSISDYDSTLVSISETQDIRVSNFKDAAKYSNSQSSGRVHIYKSFGVDLDAIDAPNVILWNSVDDAKRYDASKFKMKTRNSTFKNGYITQTYEDSVAQTRLSYLRSTDFMQSLEITCTHNTELREVKILGKNATTSLILSISHFTRIIDSEIRNATNGIDFKGGGSAGTEYATSQVYMRNTFVDAPTKFLNYIDPSVLAAGNLISNTSRGIKYISGLSDYPQLKTIANPAGDGNMVGWYIVESQFNGATRSFTTAELSSSSNTVNSFARKWLGCEVYNTTVGKFMKATGSTPTSTWVSTDGLTTITPA